MQRKSFSKYIYAAVFSGVAVLFVIFLCYMTLAGNVKIQSARTDSSYKTVENVSVQNIDDSSSPVGVRKEYSFTLEDTVENQSSLIFYTVHQLSEVSIGDTPVYSLTLDKGEGIGTSPCSNWIVVPLYPSDCGQTVTVTVTPVYKGVLNRNMEFFVGSEYDFFSSRLKADLPELILSSLCIIMGIAFIAIQLIMTAQKKGSSSDILYLGIFSLLLGLWRFTDLRISSIIFANHTPLLGYITLSALFILPAPLLLFIDERHNGKCHFLLRSAAMATCAVAFCSLICQVFGIAELRELLTACHVMLALDIVVSFVTTVIFSSNNRKHFSTRLCVGLLVVGSSFDILYFYLNGNSSGIMLTMLSFLICIIYQFTESINEMSQNANMDLNTHLLNKVSWNKFIKESVPEDEAVGVIMMDLNRLKYVNDTFGHEAGDRIITEFANILRNTVGESEIICRWGGDEFAILVRNANRNKIGGCISDINRAVNNYNSGVSEPKIYFACGYALSADFPELSRQELLAKADEFMYTNKKEWYKEFSR